MSFNKKSKSLDTPKRILMVLNSVNVNGGVQNKIMDIYRNINKKRVQFDFLVLSQSDNTFESEINSLGGKVYYFGEIRERGIFFLLCNIYKFFKKQKYFGVHSYISSNDSIILFLAKIARIKVRISHSRGAYLEEGIKKTLFPVLKMLISYSATLKLSCSKEAGELLYKGSEYEIIRNPLNFERFTNVCEEDIKKLKNKINIRDEQLIIGHIGRFTYEKNHEFILKIAEKLRDKKVNFLIILVGDGELKKSFVEKVEIMKMTKYFYFTGNQTKVENYYKLLDLFIFPSLHEGFGNVALEAQVSGKRVIASRGVSKEVDIGLGLVEFISLEKPEEWISSILNQEVMPEKSKLEIYEALRSRGFALENIIDKHYEIYGV